MRFEDDFSGFSDSSCKISASSKSKMTQKCVKIGNFTFKSKAEITRFVRGFLREKRMVDMPITAKNEEFGFLMDLVKRHPEFDNKFKTGIKGFVIYTHPINKTATETAVIDGTGKRIVFSWNSCCTGRKMTERTKLLQAMRDAVAGQITAYANESRGACEECGANEACEVDHVISFKQLAEQFLSRVTPPSEFDGVGSFNRPTFREQDFGFKAAWIAFHLQLAILQHICKDCHAKKTYNRSV